MHSRLLSRQEDVFLCRAQATIQNVVIDGVVEQRQILQQQKPRSLGVRRRVDQVRGGAAVTLLLRGQSVVQLYCWVR